MNIAICFLKTVTKPAVLALAFTVAGCSPDPSEPRPPARIVPVTSTASFGTLLNNARAERGLRTLTQSAVLTKVAQTHARDMSARGYFSHRSPNGKSAADRARAGGYDYCWIAENIAQGQRSDPEVMNSWMTSAGHRRNNLASKGREYGFGRTADNYWVLMIGSRNC